MSKGILILCRYTILLLSDGNLILQFVFPNSYPYIFPIPCESACSVVSLIMKLFYPSVPWCLAPMYC